MLFRLAIKLLFVFLFSSLYLPLFAQQTIKQIFIYEDSQKVMTANEAIHLFKKGEFIPTTTQEINIGFTKSVFWLAFQNSAAEPYGIHALSVGDIHINRIDFYKQTRDSIIHFVTGDHFPFSQRFIRGNRYYFPIDKEGIYLARIDKSNEFLQLSFRLTSILEAIEEESNIKSVIFLFSGIILLLLLFGLYLFLIEKDRVYLYYLLFVATGWLWVFSNAGYGFQYLWPNQPWFASKARPLFVLLPLIFSNRLILRYIGQANITRFKLLLHAINIILFTLLCFTLLVSLESSRYAWWPYVLFLAAIIPFVAVFIVCGILASASLRGDKLAIFYLVSNLSLFVFIILQIVFSVGGIQRFSYFFSNYGTAFGYVIAAIILTSGLVYRFYRYRIEKEFLLIEMGKQQRENTRILMQTQEGERNQIATQLHDVAGSLLSAAKINLSSLRERTLFPRDSQLALQFEKAEEAVTRVSDIVRNLSHALSPVMLQQVGFRTSLEKVVEIFNAAQKIRVELEVIGFKNYKPELNIMYASFYGIIYELLNNIVKHSQASHALIQVAEYEHSFSLLVEDNGVGFDTSITSNKLGLTGISSKVAYFSGEMTIDKNKPSGTIITIEIPIQREYE